MPKGVLHPHAYLYTNWNIDSRFLDLASDHRAAFFHCSGRKSDRRLGAPGSCVGRVGGCIQIDRAVLGVTVADLRAEGGRPALLRQLPTLRRTHGRERHHRRSTRWGSRARSPPRASHHRHRYPAWSPLQAGRRPAARSAARSRSPTPRPWPADRAAQFPQDQSASVPPRPTRHPPRILGVQATPARSAPPVTVSFPASGRLNDRLVCRTPPQARPGPSGTRTRSPTRPNIPTCTAPAIIRSRHLRVQIEALVTCPAEAAAQAETAGLGRRSRGRARVAVTGRDNEKNVPSEAHRPRCRRPWEVAHTVCATSRAGQRVISRCPCQLGPRPAGCAVPPGRRTGGH